MADDEDAGALSDVDEDPLPPPSSSSSSSTTSKPPPPSDAAQRLLDLTAELDTERRLRRAAEESLAASETRLTRLKAFAQDALRKRDDQSAAAAASARALAALQAEAATASSMLASGLDRISAKASPATPPAPLPTSAKYSAGLPALAYGVLKRANYIVDDLQAQISAQKDEVYTLQHHVEAQRAESGLLRTRMEGQEKEIGQLRKQIKHLEEKQRVTNDSVEGLMMDLTAAEEQIKRWKMAAEEAEAGRSIEQEFQIQLSPKLSDQISALTTDLMNLLNTGSLEDLQKLKGIKAQRAASIIKLRESCAFEKIANLRDIQMKDNEIEKMLSALVWPREDN